MLEDLDSLTKYGHIRQGAIKINFDVRQNIVSYHIHQRAIKINFDRVRTYVREQEN